MNLTREGDILIAAWLMVCQGCRHQHCCDIDGERDQNCNTFWNEVEEIRQEWDQEDKEV